MNVTPLEFGILGPLQVRAQGVSLPLGPPQQRALLARLLLSANEPVAAEQLMEELWEGAPPARAGHAVQVYVSALRKAFAEYGCSGRLETRRPGYLIRVEPGELDAQRFESLLEQGRLALVGGGAAASGLLREALALWRGSALADFRYAGFAQSEAGRLDELRLACLEERVEADLAAGGHSTLVPELEGLVGEHPARERLRGQLMLALYRAGRQVEALEVYRRGREWLREEVGIDPGTELQALHTQILNQDASLALEVSPPRPPTNLPAPPNRLVGRQRELEEVETLLERDDLRLLTLTGPGGIGKTRLAVEAASEVVDRYRDGVFWVPLASLRDPALVLPTVAEVLGVKGDPVSYLGSRAVLLVLDNLEQVIEATAELAPLLAGCRNLNLLATSREALHLSGEHVYAVPPLGESDAYTLFLQRASAVRSDFAPNGEVAEICRRLDGLPLAVELAAARANVLSPAAMLARLERRLPLLTGGARDLPMRQRTLRATIEWSHDLLDSDEQQLFARLAVFAGSFALEAAEQICETDVETLASLVDKSLVRRRADRFWMLESIGEFARDSLERSGEAESVASRHADWYLAYAKRADPELKGPSQREWLDRVRLDFDNIRAALSHFRSRGAAFEQLTLATSTYEVWVWGAQTAEGRRWLEEGLAGGVQHPSLCARALYQLAVVSETHGDRTRAREYAEHGLRTVGASATPSLRGSLLMALANAIELDDAQRAEALYKEALVAASTAGDRQLEAWILGNLAEVASNNRHDFKEAEQLVDKSVRTFRELGNLRGLGWALNNLGHFVFEQGRASAARQLIEEALELSAELRQLVIATYCCELLAAIELEDGEPSFAARLLGAAETFRLQSENKRAPVEQQLYERAVRQLHLGVNEQELAAGLAEGRALSLDDVVRLVRERRGALRGRSATGAS